MKVGINANVLRESVEAIRTLVDEVVFKPGKEGISAVAVDPANVAMLSFFLNKDAFSTYKVNEEEICVDLIKLSDITRMIPGSEEVSAEIVKDKIRIKFLNLEYALTPLSHSSMKEPKKPSIDLPAKIVLSGEEFWMAIKAAEKMSDHIALGVKDDTFYMEAKGDLDEVRLELQSEKLIDLKAADVRSLYSLNYLKDMGKPISKNERVTIDLGNNYPMQISFSFADGKGTIEYLLAPRIESE
jgi:proliferating cell nuclear antigen